VVCFYFGCSLKFQTNLSKSASSQFYAHNNNYQQTIFSHPTHQKKSFFFSYATNFLFASVWNLRTSSLFAAFAKWKTFYHYTTQLSFKYFLLCICISTPPPMSHTCESRKTFFLLQYKKQQQQRFKNSWTGIVVNQFEYTKIICEQEKNILALKPAYFLQQKWHTEKRTHKTDKGYNKNVNRGTQKI
jgi:hypothetical protein